MAFNVSDNSDNLEELERQDQIHCALSHNRDLDALLSKLLEGARGQEDLTAGIEAAKEHANGIDTYLRKTVDSEFLIEYGQAHATGPGQKVFDIPELLEMILEKLGIVDLLGVQCVNRQFYDTVDSSITLQRKMNLLPQAADAPTLPLEGLTTPGICIRPSWGHVRKGERISKIIHISVSFDTTLPKIGERCRRMIISNPPMTSMSAYTTCCYRRADSEDESDEHFIVQNTTGITVGDLLDAASKLNATHLLCRSATEYAHNFETGLVNVGPRFEGKLEFRDDHPAVLKRLREKDLEIEEGEHKREERAIIRAFIENKRAGVLAFCEYGIDTILTDGLAYDAGTPITTPAQASMLLKQTREEEAAYEPSSNSESDDEGESGADSTDDSDLEDGELSDLLYG